MKKALFGLGVIAVLFVGLCGFYVWHMESNRPSEVWEACMWDCRQVKYCADTIGKAVNSSVVDCTRKCNDHFSARPDAQPYLLGKYYDCGSMTGCDWYDCVNEDESNPAVKFHNDLNATEEAWREGRRQRAR